MRKRGEHKGENGRVLIVGGSEDYVGAAILAGMAAFRAGVDIVSIAAPQKVAWAVNCYNPVFITKKLKGEYFREEHSEEILKLAERADSVLIGNGMGLKKETQELVNIIIKKINKPKIIDADGIKAMKIKGVSNCIITPHEKELEIFMKNNNRKYINTNNIANKISFMKKELKDFLENDNIVLLKGKIDIIISKDKYKLNRTGNSGMTVAGTGDVLAGLTAALVAQKMKLFEAAYHAANINGRAGDYLLRRQGIGFTALELANAIPRMIK